MDKEASDLLRLALLGLLTGGGTYGAMRLGRDIPNAGAKPERPKDELSLTLPSARLPKMAAQDIEHNFSEYLNPVLAWGGGAAGGFLGASKLYELYKQKQLAAKNKQVEQQYIQTLQQAHHKVAEAKTPLVDQFLIGLLEKAGESVQKEGMWGVDFPTEGPLDTIGHQARNAAESFSKSNMGSAGIAAWLLTALGSGGATYALGRKMDKNKQEAQQKTQLPSEIKLNVV